MTVMFHWFEDPERFAAYAAAIDPMRVVVEDHMTQVHQFTGYCCVCNRIHPMLVRSGAMLGDRPSLREGLLCEGCGLSNRGRLMHWSIVDELRCQASSEGDVLLLERLSPLYTALAQEVPNLVGSEFLGDTHVPGCEYPVEGRGEVRHESVTNLSFADGSMRLVAHSDVLEHVPEYRKALAECYRVLEPGGSMVFTCPFFVQRRETLVRALIDATGRVTHIEPPEHHGDPLNPEGILAFYHHGWDLLDDLRATGFAQVQLGVTYDAFAGFVSNNFPGGGYGLMLPIIIRARKAAC